MSEEKFEGRRGTKRSRVSMGVLGVTLVAALVISALQMDRLPFLSQVSTYDVFFEEAGGLVPGDIVTVAGIEVGKVERIGIEQTGDGLLAKVSFRLNDTVVLGEGTRAAIKTETVLGRRNVTLTPDGKGRIEPGQSIPVDQTVAPYSLTDTLEDAVSTLKGSDTEQLNEALATLNEAFAETPDNMRAAVDGISRMSKAIADRDEALGDLLEKARGVSSIVGNRSDQIEKLLIDANSLLGELQLRRQALGEVITGVKDVSAELTGFVDDNNEQLQPVLDQFNQVLDILNDNEQNFSDAVDNLGPYANILGEAVASGPYFSSLVGLPTWGDYFGTFQRVLEQKYPEAFEYFTKYSGFPGWPDNWSQAPDRGSPDTPDRPTPSKLPPTAQRGG